MKLKRAILALVAIAVAMPVAAQSTRVRGYTRKDGTYVQPHHRSTPNSTRSDNWSTRGNVNPYTGRVGTRDPYAPASPSVRPYGTPSTSTNPFDAEDGE